MTKCDNDRSRQRSEETVQESVDIVAAVSSFAEAKTRVVNMEEGHGFCRLQSWLSTPLTFVRPCSSGRSTPLFCSVTSIHKERQSQSARHYGKK